jgi:hypothetical protein
MTNPRLLLFRLLEWSELNHALVLSVSCSSDLINLKFDIIVVIRAH